jgi:hypothetical protein
MIAELRRKKKHVLAREHGNFAAAQFGFDCNVEWRCLDNGLNDGNELAAVAADRG